jgi:hypothetical protein
MCGCEQLSKKIERFSFFLLCLHSSPRLIDKDYSDLPAFILERHGAQRRLAGAEDPEEEGGLEEGAAAAIAPSP